MPDLAFLAFDKFIAGLPAGVQLFSMLKANPNLLDLIATISGNRAAPGRTIERPPARAWMPCWTPASSMPCPAPVKSRP